MYEKFLEKIYNQAREPDTEAWAIRPFLRGHSIEWQQQVY